MTCTTEEGPPLEPKRSRPLMVSRAACEGMSILVDIHGIHTQTQGSRDITIYGMKWYVQVLPYMV